MKKLHLTRFAVMATVALMGSTAAWAATGASATGSTLTLQSNSETDVVSIDGGEFTGIKTIVVDRKGAAAPTYSTIMLPAAASETDDNIEAVFRPSAFHRNGDDCTLDAVSVATMNANEPYFIKLEDGASGVTTFTFEAKDGIVATGNAEHSINLSGTCFSVTGVYSKKVWNSDSNNDYGFAAGDGTGADYAGQFVKVGSGVSLYPLRAYLTCHPGKVFAKVSADAEETLPEVIKVRFLDKNGDVLSIAKMNTRTGEFKTQNNYYDLKGRKLNAKPQNKIMYVNKKVIKH